MIDDFIAYLKSELSMPVLYAHTTDPVEDASTEMPIVLVYPGSLSADPSQVDNFVRQQVTLQLVCLVACDIAQYDTQLLALRSAAIGWTRDEYTDAAELESSETVDVKGRYIWVREVYSIQYHITET